MDCDSERIWKIVETQRHNVPKKKRTPGTALSLFDRLYDCYVECTQKQSDKNFDKRFRNTVNLLQQLSPDHTHPSLVVNLYSDERGYSLILNPGGHGEEIFMPYEDNEIFSYLDNQEIPPVLMEVLSQTNHCHMYGGCIVCEVRNYRHPSLSPRHSYDSYLIMLRPTAESILQMVNEIANETNCSPEDQLLLESKLLLATQPPICLDPSTEVVWVTNRLHYNRHKFHSPAMRRYLRRRSQARRARMYHTSLQKSPPELRLHDFLATTSASLKCPRPQFSDVWKQKRLPVPSLSTTSAKAIAKSVRELASMLPEPSLISPLEQHLSVQTPSNLPSASHLRTQGQGLADEFLKSGGRTSSTAATPPSQVAGGPPSPHLSPHKTTPTIVQGQAQPSLPPPTLQPPSQPVHSRPPLTISLPLFPSRANSKLTIPTSHKTTPPVPPPTISTSVPTSLVERTHGPKGGGTAKRPRTIAPAGPTPRPVATTVGMTATKNKHTIAMGRSSGAVITPGNQRTLLHTPKQMPRLQRPPQLPPLTAATPHAMPKLHRFTAPPLPTSPHPPVPTSTRATPPMPILHRLATGNGTPPSQPFVTKLPLPALKAVVKLKKIQPTNKT